MKPALTLSLALALSSSIVATAAAQVSRPAALPGDELVAAAAGDQRTPVLSAGSDAILAVWQDQRSSPMTSGQQSGFDLFAVRLDALGMPIDPLPFPITMAGGLQSTPRVAWNGTAWLVAWVGQVSTEFYYTDALLAVRVAADGTLLDSQPIIVMPDMASGTFGDVASDGNGWAVFFTGWNGATAWVYGARIAADGTLIDATPKGLFSPGGSPYTPYGASAAWAGGRYLVTWSQWFSGADDVRGRIFDAALAPQGAVFNLATAADYEVHPDVASSGSGFFVLWDRYNNCCVGGASAAYGTRVTTAGAVLDGPVGKAIYDTDGYGFQGCEPAVGWDGSQWIASWTAPLALGQLEVRAARISAAGVVLDFNGFSVDPTSPRQEASAVVGRPGGGSLIAWQDSRMNVGQAADIHGARIETNGLSTPVGALSLAAPAQVRADAASGPGGGALLVWTSMLSGSTRVLGQLVTAQGQPVGEPLEVASGGTLGNAHVAWNGTVWLVTWDAPGGVFARRVGGDQALLGPAFLVMPGSINDVAAHGDVFLVTALVPEPNPEYVNVRSRRVAASTGALLDASSVLVGSTYARAQAIEAFEGGFLLAWQRHATHDQPYSSILLRAISVDNVPGTQLSFTSTSSYNQMPALAAGDGTLLLTWQLGPESSTNQDVVARLIGPGPTLLGGAITVSAGPRSEQLPAAAWDGSEYLVSWQDLRATQDYLFDRRTDVYAARVTTAGAVLDPDGIPLAVDTVPEAWVAMAALGPGAALVAWSDFQEWAPFASYRLAFSTLGELSPWIDLGAALAGSNGTPRLEGDGLLHAGTPMSLQLSAAPPLAPVTLILGFSALNAPFKGGTLVPHPDLLVAGLLSNASGGLTLGATWPAAVPPGTALFLQAWIADATGPAGLAASNGLEALTP
jgi:hypothetical protein